MNILYASGGMVLCKICSNWYPCPQCKTADAKCFTAPLKSPANKSQLTTIAANKPGSYNMLQKEEASKISCVGKTNLPMPSFSSPT